MTGRSLPLFPASVVGSIPRPLVVRELIEKPHWDAVDSATMDAAIRFVVAMQERAGLDVVNDGEWRRRSYIGVIAELAHGFTLETNPADGRPWTVVTERLTPKPAGFVAAEAAFVKQVATVATKITLPAPALLGERLWDAERSRKAYPTCEDFVRACVAPLRAEIALLRDIGVEIVQIDDPHLCLFVDPDVRARHDDPDRAADRVRQAAQAGDALWNLHVALRDGRTAGAELPLRTLDGLGVTSPWIELARAEWLAASDRRAEAVACLDRLAPAAEKSVALSLRTGEIRLAFGDLVRAVELFRNAALIDRANPETLRAEFLLACALALDHQEPAAAAILRRLAGQTPADLREWMRGDAPGVRAIRETELLREAARTR